MCRLLSGFSYPSVCLDSSNSSITLWAAEALSLAALPAGCWKHQPRDKNRLREGLGLLMMTAGTQLNDNTRGQIACEKHTCLPTMTRATEEEVKPGEYTEEMDRQTEWRGEIIQYKGFKRLKVNN